MIFTLSVFKMIRRGWKRMSHIGVETDLPEYKQKGIILSNQISTILIVSLVISISYVSTLGDLDHLFNVISLIAISLMILVLNKLGFINASRLLGSIAPPLLIYISIVVSSLDDIAFFYNSYVILTFCIVPVLVFDLKNEKFYLITSLIISFCSLLISDQLLIQAKESSALSDYFDQNALLIKIPLIEMWLIFVFAMLFLKHINSKYEKMLRSANEELSEKNDETITRMQELSQANEKLKQQQNDMIAQRDFIDKKNKELKAYQDKLLDYVCELSRSKDQLAVKEAENESILRALRQNFIMAEFDLDGKIVWIAPKTLAYLGMSESDLIGVDSKSFIKSIDEDLNFDESLKTLWDNILDGQSVSADLELNFKGKLLHVSITYAPIVDAKNQPFKILAIAEDISDVTNQKKKFIEMNEILMKQQSEIKDQNEKLQQQKEEISAMNETLEDRVKERTLVLEQKNKQLAEYAFINAHLLRAPVSSILGLINLLEYEKLSEEEKEIYHYLKKSINQLDKIVFKINSAIQQNKEIDREFLRE